MKLSWSKEPNETGLARVVQWPRGRVLKLNKKQVAFVQPMSASADGWYWYGGSADPYVKWENTAGAPRATMGEAVEELLQRDLGYGICGRS